MIQQIKIGSRTIGPDSPPFIIAEMSGNHNQSLDRALEIVDAAAKAGAHALKLQTYTADTMTIDVRKGEFLIEDKNSLWAGKNLYELYQQAHTPWEWHGPIFQRCKELGMEYLSTPFDNSAVDFLEECDVPFYKIASFENIDLPLIEYVASKKKPVIVSTGMATVSEMQDIVDVFKKVENPNLILLKCTSTYPATPENTNIRTIPHMRELFDVQVGLSDHTLGVGVAVASVALGATVIEKHFTLSRADGGVDSAFSLEPHELEALVAETERAWRGLGVIHYGRTEKELNSLQFRRSLYIVEDIKSGEVLTTKNLRAIRPGLGLPPKYINEVLGKRVNRDLSKGTAFKIDYLFH